MSGLVAPERDNSLTATLDRESYLSAILGGGDDGAAKAADAGLDLGMSLHRLYDPSRSLPSSIMACLTCFHICFSR